MLTANETKLSFRAIECFIAIVEEASVTDAAKRLGASRSAVSLQLTNLEKALGAKLIERSSQRFALTPAGETFHPRALRILDEVSAAAASLSGSTVSPRMRLKLSLIDEFDRHVLPDWLGDMRQRYPNMRFNIHSGASHENHSALGNRSADLIVAVDAMETADWVEEHPLLKDPYILVASSMLGPDPDLAALAKRPFVRYSRDLYIGRQIEAQLRRSKAVPQREHELSSNLSVFSMVARSGGWCISTASAFSGTFSQDGKSWADLGIAACPLPFPNFSRQISLYARRDSLDDIPLQFAETLRTVIDRALVRPALQQIPFLQNDDSFRTLT